MFPGRIGRFRRGHHCYPRRAPPFSVEPLLRPSSASNRSVVSSPATLFYFPASFPLVSAVSGIGTSLRRCSRRAPPLAHAAGQLLRVPARAAASPRAAWGRWSSPAPPRRLPTPPPAGNTRTAPPLSRRRREPPYARAPAPRPALPARPRPPRTRPRLDLAAVAGRPPLGESSAAPPRADWPRAARAGEAEEGAGWAPWQVGPGCQPPLLLFFFYFKWLKPSKSCRNL